MEDLFKIYEKWCRKRGLKLETTYISHATIGCSRIEFSVAGGYDLFLEEAGGHRFQRNSPTEKRGRTHTSTVTVSVLPVIPETDIKINEKDLEWKTEKASGPGGQNVNKVETAVRLKHLPTDVEVRCREERNQHQNKRIALEKLRAKLYAYEEGKKNKGLKAQKRSQAGSGMRGDKIRTYRFQDDIATNHLTGKKCNLNDILSGNLDAIRR